MLLLFTAVEVSGRDISLTFKRLDAIPQIRLDLVMHSQLIDNYSANIFITLGIWTVIQRRLPLHHKRALYINARKNYNGWRFF